MDTFFITNLNQYAEEGWLEMAANVMARKNAESLTLSSCDELKSFIKDMNSRT